MPKNRLNNDKKSSSIWSSLDDKYKASIYSLICGFLVLVIIFYFSIQKNYIEHKKIYSYVNDFNELDNKKTLTKVSYDENTVKNAPKELIWSEYIVRHGDSLSSIFKKKSLTAKNVIEFTSNNLSSPLLQMHPGQKIKFGFSSDGALEELKYIKSDKESYIYTRLNEEKGASFFARKIDSSPKKITIYRDSIIKDSLFVSGKKSGLPSNIIMELANIFSWDIDFALDIREGDKFSVLYEGLFLYGEKITGSKILAAEFTNQGKSYKAVRYLDSSGEVNYFTPEGRNIRKSFLRAPLDFTRISSNFNLKRMHPIHKKIMAHRGVDYVAPLGTPVFASGDGRVKASSYNRANGNYIFIQHGGGIITKYLHLHKRKVKKGMRVTQRQIIGTLGSTGYSTGPHLHYEFVVNGSHKNPRNVDLPHSDPVKKNEFDRFYRITKPLIAELKRHQKASKLALLSTQ
jgi:murein DD-endopeptidase MepM/ murein hydrolase activator NlpD